MTSNQENSVLRQIYKSMGFNDDEINNHIKQDPPRDSDSDITESTVITMECLGLK